MKLVISALERQVRIESARCLERTKMIQNPECFLGEKLQEANPAYLAELEEALIVLKAYKPQ